MAATDDRLPVDELAAYHHALAHPVRVHVLRLLRQHGAIPLADLRRDLSQLHGDIDTRTLQHHVDKMHRAGIVDLERLGGRYRVHLVRDLKVRITRA